jgi:translocation and assembly module TamB
MDYWLHFCIKAGKYCVYLVPPVKKFFIRILKVILWILGSVFFLLILVVIALQFKQTQTFITGKVISYVSKKTKSKISLAEINIAFPKYIVLKELYLEDQQKDTLLYSHLFKVDINLWKLFSKKIEISTVVLEKFTSHISRTLPDSSFNFSFIPTAFTDKNAAPSKKDTTKSSWQFSLLEVRLKDLFLTYNDEVSGNDATLKLGYFDVGLKVFDLSQNKFKIKNISLNDTYVQLIQTKPAAPKKEDPKTQSPELGLEQLLLTNITIDYQNRMQGQKALLHLGSSRLLVTKIDLNNQRIVLNSFRLYNTQVSYDQFKRGNNSVITAKDTVVKAISKGGSNTGWNIALNALDLKNNSVRFDDANKPETKNAMDFNHLAVKNISIQIEKIKYSPASTTAKINELSFSDKSGFALRHLSTVLVFDSVHAALGQLNLQTSSSKIRNNLAIGYSSLAAIGDSLGELKVKARLKDSEIGFSDLLYFVPALQQQNFFTKNKVGIIKVTSNISGKVKDLKIENFELATASATHITLNGEIQGLPAIDKTNFDIVLNDFSTGKKDVNALLPSNKLPAVLNVPESIKLNGFFKGFLNKFSAEVQLNSSIGKALAQLNMYPGPANKKGYKASITIENLDLGNLLKQQKNMGTFTLKAAVEGTGLSPTDINAVVQLAVQKAELNGYPYQNLKLDGKLIKQRFVGKTSIDDKNLAFTFDGDINLEKGQEQFNFVFNLKGAALEALKVTKDDVRLSGILSSKMKGNQMNTMNGNIDLKKFIIIKNGKEYPVDSMFFVSVNGSDKSAVSFKSHMMSGKFSGNVSLLDLPKVLEQNLDGYFSLQDTSMDKTAPSQNFTFAFELRDPSLLKDVLLPGLSDLSPLTINGSYSSPEKKLDIALNLPLANYKGTRVDSLSIGIHSDATALNYGMHLVGITKGDYKIDNTDLLGKVAKDSIHFLMGMTRPNKTRPLAMSGLVTNKNGMYKLHIDTAGFILNNSRWILPENNYLGFGKSFVANDMKLRSGASMVFLNNISERQAKEPLRLEFSDFDLMALSKILSENQAIISGLLEGNIVFDSMQKRTVFTSDLKIKNFGYLNKPFGDISLVADNKAADRYTVKLGISGNNNDIRAEGYYEAKQDHENLNFDVHVHPLNLASIESFTQGQVKKLKGNVAGDLKISGSSKQPVISGDLAFQQVGLVPEATKSTITLKDEHIVFHQGGIQFKSFTLVDSLKNTATINGSLLTSNYTDYSFDLDLSTKDFLALNTKAGDNTLYYGKLLLDTKAHVTGNPARPLITARVKVKEGTNLTAIKPEPTVAAEDSKGIVLFFDPRREKMHRIMEEGLKTDTSKNKITGLDLTLDLGISPLAQFKVVVDKASGDSLLLQGNANLSLGLDPSGKTSLSGRYEINKGSYSLTVNDFIKRDFEIAKGSSITWNGDPTSAEIDIAAIYTAKTAPLALVEDQLAGMSEGQRSMYKKEIPFQVYLYVKGDLMTPIISFGLQMPERYRGEMGGTVYAKIQQLNQDEAQLNQQVFALLVLDRFIANDPLSNPGGGGLSSSARSSVSKVLTDQLNTMTGKYVKGVDINLGVDSYEDNSKSGNDRNTTKVNYGVSKELFKDKVKVQVGGNVDVEGTRASKNDLGNVVGDLSLEYKLSEDGRYLLRGLRKTQYEGAIEGELTRTGAAVIYVRDYNSFWEILHKPKAAPAEQQ